MARDSLNFSHAVLDTSVVVKWFRQGEILAPQALFLRAAYLDGQLAISAPDLLAYELTNVLRYKGDLASDQLGEAIESLFSMGLDWVPPSSLAMRRAAVLAREHEITVCDSTFAACAETLGAEFVTADRGLAGRLAALPRVTYLGTLPLVQ